MKSSNLLKLAFKSVVKNKMRSLLTMLGIIIGVGAVIVMVAIGEGAQQQIEDRINGLGTNLIIVAPGAAMTAGVNQGQGTFSRLTLEDYDKLNNEAVQVSGISPVVMNMNQIIGGGRNWRARIMGVSEDYLEMRNWPLASGSSFDEAEVRAVRKVAILGKTVAENLFPGEDPVGQQIQIRDIPFQVIGVLSEKGQGAAGEDQDDLVLAPYTTVYNRLAGQRAFIGQIMASAYNANDIPAAQAEISAIMREAHGLEQGEADDFTVRNQADLAETFTATTEVMSTLLAAIASISLLVGGIGIMNIMLVSVTERTREIGIRLAIGARGGDVLTQFLVEAIVLSLLGGIVGVIVGYASTQIVASQTGWSTVIEPTTVGIALGFSAAVGIFFGFYPARKASALNPIEALRYE
jgi:putative ABC transport system permease protein